MVYLFETCRKLYLCDKGNILSSMVGTQRKIRKEFSFPRELNSFARRKHKLEINSVHA